MNSEQITAFLQEHWYIASVLIGAVISVSYTHLDVYKRQPTQRILVTVRLERLWGFPNKKGSAING